MSIYGQRFSTAAVCTDSSPLGVKQRLMRPAAQAFGPDAPDQNGQNLMVSGHLPHTSYAAFDCQAACFRLAAAATTAAASPGMHVHMPHSAHHLPLTGPGTLHSQAAGPATRRPLHRPRSTGPSPSWNGRRRPSQVMRRSLRQRMVQQEAPAIRTTPLAVGTQRAPAIKRSQELVPGRTDAAMTLHLGKAGGVPPGVEHSHLRGGSQHPGLGVTSGV